MLASFCSLAVLFNAENKVIQKYVNGKIVSKAIVRFFMQLKVLGNLFQALQISCIIQFFVDSSEMRDACQGLSLLF